MKKFFSVFILSILGLQVAISATLSISPSSSNVSESKSFTSTIYLNSGGQSINAVQGVINFPNDKLQVVSVSKSSSLVDFWVKDPSYSNSSGTINFEGAIIAGYSGSSGKILSVTFKPKSLGSANVTFSTAQALANDGSGTDVLSGTSPAKYTIIEDEKPETPVVKETTKEIVATDTEHVTTLPIISTTTEIISTSTVEQVYVKQEAQQPGFSYNKQSIIYFLLILFVVLILLARKYVSESFDNKQAEFYLANIDKEIEGYVNEIKKIKVQKKMLADKEKDFKNKIKEIKSKLDKLSDK
jgi:hypothetical protein